ncbi:C4-dicarboxylate ABC transporter substrate-binding protein [Brevirhabdus pacifica]|uniref:C4-dicarboxylate ABC transporter substrate-binding protein n=1 Tax=Brevirhabdus pacifica TaxID=1267768 RepID=A0A1U7DLU1_9RHOB|nr:TRAP transporter substrate-binding protein [Brevirhabdus pacifica]APX90964.1 C4-dicarboxylate ABC transporter substrate-binding protein [Brevirhabdus pacifica]OWU76949.1 C4-dicarboxylate ABC transporter substrate-binding protein [Loktanella sp. 22II-4b]
MMRPLAVTAMLLAGTTLQAETLSVVGSWSGLPLHKNYEQPFWTEKLPAAAGDLDVSLTTHDQMGIGGGDVFRMLGDGVFDVGMTVADYAVADTPALEGLDVPMLADDADQAKKLVDAARPLVDDIYKDVFNAKVLGVAPYPPQVVFCNAEIGSLEDLKGKKVRASGRMTAKLLDALGAEGVNVSFGEVPGALQKGVVDCAVTGAGSGYSAGWWEVSTHLLPIPLGGWDPVVIAMNMDKWNSLSPELQQTVQTGVDQDLVAPAWTAAQGALETDIACLTGNGECPVGDAHEMTLVEPAEGDVATVREALTGTVLPDWSERVGAEWTARWNDTVGAAAGLTIE